MAVQAGREAVAAYGVEATRRLEGVLRERLSMVCLGGSYALHDWEPATSDVDLLAVAERPIPDPDGDAIVEALRVEALPSPGHRLEFTLVTRGEVRIARRRSRVELNFDSAPDRLEVHRSTVRADAHWLTLDLEVARRCAVSLHGPPPEELIAARPAAWLRQAQLDALAWYARHEPNSNQRVLNACRAWAFGADGLLLGKGPAAAWALGRGGDRELIEEALRVRRGGPPSALAEPAIGELVARARAALGG